MPSFKAFGQRDPEKKIPQRICHIIAWLPCWSRDPDQLNKYYFPPTHVSSLRKLVTIGPVAFQSLFELIKISESMVKNQTKTLTCCTHKSSSTYTHNCITSIISINSNALAFFYKKEIIWPCLENGQWQPISSVDKSWQYSHTKNKAVSWFRRVFFYHTIWTWQKYWSSDLDYLNKF